MSDKTYLVVGLGNIGPEYSTTRHNIGFMILDAWAQASNIPFSFVRYGELAIIKEKGRQFYLLKPSTYVNLSGNAVRYWLQQLDLPIERLIVICDDLNLPFESVRMRKSGGPGGHNGLKHIEELLQSPNYPRIRVGVGHDFAQGQQIDFVLGGFSNEQLDFMPQLYSKVIQGVKDWAFVGVERAMNSFNVKKAKKNDEI